MEGTQIVGIPGVVDGMSLMTVWKRIFLLQRKGDEKIYESKNCTRK